MEIEQEKKAVESTQQEKILDTIPSQNEIDKAGHNYLRLVDEKIKHFRMMSNEDEAKLEESMILVRNGAGERIDHFKILCARPKLKLEDLQLEE